MCKVKSLQIPLISRRNYLESLQSVRKSAMELTGCLDYFAKKLEILSIESKQLSIKDIGDLCSEGNRRSLKRFLRECWRRMY